MLKIIIKKNNETEILLHMTILYSTHCPKCKSLEHRLKINKIDYEIVDDKDVIIQKGFASAPQLEVNGKIMDYMEAVKWITENGGNHNEE